ncbi:transcription factor IIIA-like [Pundamilia nyererei]|uniref:Transcription factor IIIA n=1 Tax=Pundamilia nyererei TaxID=303518 RepID=A0A9Y3S3T1_9CICH|nr:PREDICTED: transcription factor IIIA-like [Pundamilia nyererei]
MGNEDVISWHRKWRHVEKPSGKRRYREKKRVFERAKNNSPVNAAEMEAKVESYKRYICSFSGCSAAYNKQWKLDAHLCKHTGVKPYSCERDGCSKAFCSKYHLARHELSHSGEKPFRCTVDGCAEAFTTNANRARHIGRIHCLEPRKYVCMFEGCGLEFKKNKQLKSHMCEQHTQLPPYQCTYEGCQMRFSFPSKLKRHEKVHRGYPCKEESCVFTGKTWTEYLKHRKEQHRVTLKCEQCSRVFRDTWFLQQHQHIHSEMRVVLKCPRDTCDRSFTTAFNLQSHISSFHEEHRPFVCTHAGCGKTFAMNQSLQRHSVVHDPQRKKLKKPRAKRSLASRLSGYCETKRVVYKMQPEHAAHKQSSQEKADQPGPFELVSLLQDASLLCSPAVDRQGLTNTLATPLSV